MDVVLAEVNAWRGACMHHFSQVEMAVTETLLALSAARPNDDRVKLRHLVGQRLEDLTVATAPDGPFGEVGKQLQDELLHFRREHEAFRILLCHGVAKVAVDRQGSWLVVWRTLSFRGRQSDRTTTVMEKDQALAISDALKRDGTKLSSLLGQLRKTVAG
jgi:hypothetical protein